MNLTETLITINKYNPIFNNMDSLKLNTIILSDLEKPRMNYLSLK